MNIYNYDVRYAVRGTQQSSDARHAARSIASENVVRSRTKLVRYGTQHTGQQ